ncbi:IS66-like element accessory protein TnpA [Pseudomonas fragi]|uniref:IS66-like element accessory protein TnpA n=1 Tax=Pseudomonas fragi TaxID=296 RepID=UPI001475BC99|nr:transposase [Pseudomonas fragi]NNB13220.1 transposase [Pseudomonas fragi]NNB22113.1 transposase [Pseudomonas fragi]
MPQRNSYPKPFKAQVVQECLQPGAKISSVAIHHGINANVIRKWLLMFRDQTPTTLPAFVPVQFSPKRATEETVKDALTRLPTQMAIEIRQLLPHQWVAPSH